MSLSRFSSRLIVLIAPLMLVACVGVSTTTDEPPPATPESTATHQEAVSAEDETANTPTPEPILEPTSEPISEPVDWTMTASVDGDYYVLGNPNAPIRLVDYSDFM